MAGELAALFDAIPDQDLLDSLKTYYAGRRGYTHIVLWRTYVAMTYLSLPSFASLIRALQDNPNLREACGINDTDGIPSTFAYSRFMKKLGNYWPRVKNIIRNLTRHLFDTLPGFGKSVAIDSTDIKGHSNGSKKGKNGKVSDPDAGWCVKSNTEGHRKYVWGYKVHILCDTEYELPIAVDVTPGNVHDSKKALNLLGQTRWTYSKFHPDFGPAVYLAREIAKAQGRTLSIDSCFPYDGSYGSDRGIPGTQWIHIDQTTFDSWLDPRDYRPPPLP